MNNIIIESSARYFAKSLIILAKKIKKNPGKLTTPGWFEQKLELLKKEYIHVSNKSHKGFDCSDNGLLSLKKYPNEIDGDFDCSFNELTSLRGCPLKINGSFYCYGNNLISLEHGPKEVNGEYWCDNNRLTSLKGAPEKINGDFYCFNNDLFSLEYCPREVNGNFWCYNNAEHFTIKEIESVCNVSGKIYVED